MIAFVYENGKLKLQERPVPHASAGSAVVKVDAASICGTDLRIYKYGSDKIKPGTVVGHEFCGTIVELGADVRGFKAGDRVTAAPAIGCGSCYMCLRGKYNMCESLKTIGFQYDGCFAEYLEIPAEAFAMGNVNHVKDNVSAPEASLAEPIACVVNSHGYLKIGKGDFVAVFGSGFIGCIHAELAMAAGAERVIVIEVANERIEEAKALLPGIYAVNPTQEDLYKRVMELTDGRGADVAITACSVGKAQSDAQKISAKCARISLFGGIPGEQSAGFIDSNLIHYRELSVFGVHASTAAQNRQVLSWMAEGKIDVKKYITRVFKLKDIEEAFKEAGAQRLIKAIVVP